MHPLIIGLFHDKGMASRAVRALRAAGVSETQLSVVSRTHQEAGALARESGATPGAEIEDSRPAAMLGELGGQILAAIALVLPGIGPIVAAGPLSAELGEALGHAAGGLSATLNRVGIPDVRADALETAVEHGAVLIGVHTTTTCLVEMRALLEQQGAADIEVGEWQE